jgi:hypothetical protein
MLFILDYAFYGNLISTTATVIKITIRISNVDKLPFSTRGSGGVTVLSGLFVIFQLLF